MLRVWLTSCLVALPSTIQRLLLVRALHSVGQWMLVVDFAVYLQVLQWCGTAIEMALSSVGFFGAAIEGKHAKR